MSSRHMATKTTLQIAVLCCREQKSLTISLIKIVKEYLNQIVEFTEGASDQQCQILQVGVLCTTLLICLTTTTNKASAANLFIVRGE